MTDDRWVTILIALAIAGYGLCFLLLLVKWRRVAWAAGGLAWTANLAIFVVNWIHAGHPPFGNMYHVLVVLAGCFLPLYAALRGRAIPAWLAPHFAMASCVPIIGVLFMERNLQWRRMAALRSPWFVPHVFAYMVSYALLAVAFFVLVSGLASRLWERQGRFLGQARQAACAVSRLAFPLLTFGLLSGALWAEEAWGVYWSWDPKETWSLITWTLYVVYFHARCSRRTRPLEIPLHLLAFAALVTTFVLVNLLPRFGGLHSYS